MKILRTTDRNFRYDFGKIYKNLLDAAESVETTTTDILDDIKRMGDQALVKYTEQYDGVQMTSKSFEVSKRERQAAMHKVAAAEIEALEKLAERAKKFASHGKLKDWKSEFGGMTMGVRYLPLKRVGIYVSGMQPFYPGTIILVSALAREAGVKELCLVHPWIKGDYSPRVMAAAEIAGIDVVYKIGGVQAIGALAYGTKSIPAVDKIVGTGDRFMNIAGRMVFGYCSVDMMSGPGELCILCDGSTPAKYVAADLLAFAENDENALPLVITTNASYASRVDGEVRLQLSRLKRKETANLVVQKRALIVLARSTKEALDLVNETASQNLVLAVKDPDSLVDKIENAGAIHVGPYSAPGLIHFGAGSPNVLPTQGSSRYFSALTVNSFMKASTMHWVEPNALKKMSGPVLTLAQSEGLEAHAQAISARVEK